jgi:uncharacterized protein YegP (UPF0339 family)
MAGKFELRTSKNGQFFFNLRAGNGEVILTGENYSSRQAALDGIESVRKNSPVDALFERKVAANAQPYFSLRGTNGQSIGKSEMYSNTMAMENGIASVKRNAPGAKLDDPTATT